MNIVLLVIDTLRYDHVGANRSDDLVSTPNLDRIAAESIRFDQAYAASFPTIPFRTDVLTGKTGSPFHIWKPLPHSAWTVVDALKDAGYATQLIHDTPHLVNGGHNFDWPFSAWTFIRGGEVDRSWVGDIVWPDNWELDPFFDFLGKDAAEIPHVYTYARTNRRRESLADWNAARLFDTAAQCLRDNANRSDLFLWVDCFDPHEPWDAPPEFVKRFDPRPDADGCFDPRLFIHRHGFDYPEESIPVIAAFYRAKLAWMDHCLGSFLDTFYETGLAENSALLVMGDHGTWLGEHGRFGKGQPVDEAIAHVPLFIRLPGGRADRSDLIVQPQDLFGTLAGLGKASVRPGLDTHDLLSLAEADESGARELAVSAPAASGWGRYFFTVFTPEWQLQWHPKPSDCVLHRPGSLDDVASSHAGVVEDLHAAGLKELARRNAHPGLIAWLKSGAEGGPPKAIPLYDGGLVPEGYIQYWNRNFKTR